MTWGDDPAGTDLSFGVTAPVGTDAPSEAAAASASVEADAAEFERAAEETGVVAAAAGGERVEWQPVVVGDQVEWQPVTVPDAPPEPARGYGDESYHEEAPSAAADEAWAGAEGAAPTPATEGGDAASEPSISEPEFEYPPEAELEPEWDAAEVTEPASPVSGNGAAGGPPSRPHPPSPVTAGVPPAEPRTGRTGGRRAPEGQAPAPDKTKRQVILLSILTGVVVLVAVLGFVLSRGAADKGEQATPSTTQAPAGAPAPTLPEADLEPYTDELAGFTVKVPKTWDRLRPPVADLRLVVTAGGDDAFSVRTIPIETPATVENITNFKAVTDAIIFGDKSAKLLREQLVTLNGLLCYYYLYTFQDQASGQEGVHAHYFVFEGRRMFSLVFQSLPTDDFRRQAGIFDQIAESFVARPPTTTTTAAPPPTAPPETSPTTVP